MGDTIDLTGDGGVIKTIVRQAKADAIAPTDDLPLVDGMHLLPTFTILLFIGTVMKHSKLLMDKSVYRLIIISNHQIILVLC